MRRTAESWTGLSPGRIRWAHLNDQQQLRATCTGARSIQDALEGHPRDSCKPYLPELRAMFRQQGLDWDQQSLRARTQLRAGD
ncbi:MAG: hypothetical protein VKM92_02140 [Cyanobacteriota bacterium]|nr:hypothetical protein [Cyanobacteriota bacterium]